jgi:hypothetical protein
MQELRQYATALCRYKNRVASHPQVVLWYPPRSTTVAVPWRPSEKPIS